MAGLGDIVHWTAQPIAQIVDRAFGTDLQHCTGCAQRREVLNAWSNRLFGVGNVVATKEGNKMANYIVTITKAVEADDPVDAVIKSKDVPPMNIAAMLTQQPVPQQPQPQPKK